MNKFYVYCYFDPISNVPFYIGKGTGKRYKRHLSDLSDTYKARKIRKIKALGLEPIIEFIDQNLSEEQAFELEMFLIQEIGRYNLGTGPLTNLTDGGEGCSGMKHSIETIRVIKEKRALQIFSEETRQKLSKMRKGVPKSEEHKQKIGAAQKGVPKSEEATKNNSKSHSRQVSINGVLYDSAKIAAQELGISHSVITKRCRSTEERFSMYFYTDGKVKTQAPFSEGTLQKMKESAKNRSK